MLEETNRREFLEANRDVMRGIVEEALALTATLSAKVVEGEKVWFRDLLVGILKSAYENYRSIELEITEVPTRAAWSARNLLELRVIAYYVLASQKNAQDFVDDVAAANKELLEAILSHTEISNSLFAAFLRKVGLDSKEEFKDVIERADRTERSSPDLSAPSRESELNAIVIEEASVESHRRSNYGVAMARLDRDNGNFGVSYRVYSKFIHPTAFSILASTHEDICSALITLISQDADTSMSVIFAAISNHLDTHGIGWPS